MEKNAMAEPGFRQTQYAFAAYIRDPENYPVPPGVKPERMHMYRELFFNNIKSFLGSSFPVLKQVLGEPRWIELAQDFFRRHRSATPYFADFAEEFLAFLRNQRADHPDDPPFLLELAHYEWLELALSLMEGEAPQESRELQENPLTCRIVLSDLVCPVAYRFPVHRIGENCQPTQPPDKPTFLAVYRDRQDDVHFLELNAASFRLLQIIEENSPVAALECLRMIAEELGNIDPSSLLEYGAETLRELGSRSIIGTV